MNNILIPFVLCVVFTSCNSSSGQLGASNNMEESKNREVFIKEYKSLSNPNILNDSLTFRFGEIWLESKWRYAKDPENTIIEDGFQLRINTEEKLPLGLDKTWSIGKDFKSYMRQSSEFGLIGDFSIYPKDTIRFYIVKGQVTKEPSLEEVIIGELILVEK